MVLQFFASPASEDILSALSTHSPENPFASLAYFRAMQRAGYETWVLGMREGANLNCGCGAFIESGRFNRGLQIVSMPHLEAGSEFWKGLLDFSHKLRISSLLLNSFGSQSASQIPALSSHGEVKDRCEYLLDLTGNLESQMSASRRRHVRKAIKEGLEIRRTRSIGDLAVHHALMNASMERRQNRGETVQFTRGSRLDRSLLEYESGELWQAACNGEIVSSVLVVYSLEGSYYRSAGSSPMGMKLNAASLLNFRVAQELANDGLKYYNFGGAGDGTTLAQFKRSFGAQRIPLTAASFYVGPLWKRYLTGSIQLFSSGRLALSRAFSAK